MIKKIIKILFGEYDGDERELFEERRADELSGLVMLVLSAVLIVVNYLNKLPYSDISGIIFTSLGIGNVFRYKRLGNKKHILSGIFLIILGSLFLLHHFLVTVSGVKL